MEASAHLEVLALKRQVDHLVRVGDLDEAVLQEISNRRKIFEATVKRKGEALSQSRRTSGVWTVARSCSSCVLTCPSASNWQKRLRDLEHAREESKKRNEEVLVSLAQYRICV
eukprot:765957-Hanusia_phi.AAC.4